MTNIGNYDYQGLCQSFIKQDRPKAKTAENRLSYEGNTLYSYDSILAVLDTKENVLLIDSNIASYSNTSSKHSSKLYDAVPKAIKIFSVYNIHSIEDSVNAYLNNIDTLLDNHKRARKRGAVYADMIIGTYKILIEYMNYKKVDKRTKLYKLHNKVFKQLLKAGILCNSTR